MGYRMWQKIVKQKYRFVGRQDGPVSYENVGYIIMNNTYNLN